MSRTRNLPTSMQASRIAAADRIARRAKAETTAENDARSEKITRLRELRRAKEAGDQAVLTPHQLSAENEM
jgi:hypothetical protein